MERETVGPVPSGIDGLWGEGEAKEEGGMDRHMDLDFFSSEFRSGGNWNSRYTEAYADGTSCSCSVLEF